ncbi:sesquiterpene synthase 15b-like isoform X2 [Nicotiana tabacum]|uniref:(-)-germacrene D synthase-like isoform X2 n=2 Tax=Nicotiana TaxID=4085 RepID=A0A1S4CQ61_TOBAC|nr:PREDICTED: (-)-germacrene D synthase-like isoform X2 [Nicotiana sylvestris]XP_016503373.1 PREDICTED: (-)-germacrene D synthase-like isoform X2 [Nicotiana tabacum]
MDGFAGEAEVTRRCGNHHPTVWGDHFLAYSHLSGANEWEKKQHEHLKEEVRKMLVMAPSKSLQNLDLINAIQCLGVAYHFEHEIEESLAFIYSCYDQLNGEADETDLHTVALRFRLLRQHGYYVSSDVFRKFTDDQGNYKKALVGDVQGLLSLYEATQFRVHSEEILGEAVNFTTTHLKLLLPTLSNSFAMKISNALKYPINCTMVTAATRKYISFYQEDKAHDDVLLNLAKLDYNILQKMYKTELCDITRWWKELDFTKALPFTRDRVVELYFWSLSVYFEPQYKVGRNILTKVLCFISIADDIYGTYGTIDELTLLTNAIERWNIDDISEKLPSYMKLYYLALLDVYSEIEKELAKENKSFQLNYSIAEMKKLIKAYFQEAKWYHGNNVPTMEQYVKNGIRSSTIPCLVTLSWLGIGNEATKEAHDWLASEPPILVASSIIARLSNDIVSHEREQEGGDISGVVCYMNEYGVTKEEAYMEIRKIMDNSWKDLNRECLKPIVIPRVLLMPVLNLARMSEFSYKDEDSYTFSKNNLKDIISEVLVDPITM